ncbi:hypothetical protein ACHQM5_028022 [Ranunculus cassubicifolius]
MPFKTILCLALLIQSTIITFSLGFQDLNTNTEFMMKKKACTGKMGLCFWEMEEEMDSEINRRMLIVGKRYISYETLKRDVVPCGRPGASYYDCHAMGQANPYTKSCEKIVGCRS